MKLDMTKILMTLEGKPFKQNLPSGLMEDWAPTLKEAIFSVLTGIIREDQDLNVDGKMKLYRLAQRVAASGQFEEFTVDELATIKQRANKVYTGVQFFGTFADALEVPVIEAAPAAKVAPHDDGTIEHAPPQA